VIYLDSSALVKLVRPEVETFALEEYLQGSRRRPQVASSIVITEMRRAVVKHAPPDVTDTVTELLGRLILLPVNRPVLEHAGMLPGRYLRSLEAIHLASALRLRSALTALVTYDQRMRGAAADAGVPTVTPS
jgi:predicted nucleic acid-binding protein